MINPVINNQSAIINRNKSWEILNDYIPDWVNIHNVGLDQFFTKPEIAKNCFRSLLGLIKRDKANKIDYNFIEPSAGIGAFYKLLPKSRRIGIDIVNFIPEYIQSDFLAWIPNDNKQKYISVGNPPFGYRGWLALSFLNHAAKFSDYVGFIVPMSFQSKGKSNIQNRVKGLHLIHSELLPSDSFIDSYGKNVKVNALWQVWSRNFTSQPVIKKSCDQYIELFTVDMRKERLCGVKRMHEASFFLQRTFYKEPPKLVKSFDQVKYVCGYGIVIKKKNREVIEILNNTDWKQYSNLASHNCRHISMCHIRDALINGSLVDV